MTTLLELITAAGKRNTVITDALAVLDSEVDDKGGFSGIAIKGAYKVVKGVSPSFIREAVDSLLDPFLNALDPLYQEAKGKGISPKDHLIANKSRTADALLSITDAKAARAKNQVVKKTYEKLRGMAKEHVEAAIPRLGDLLLKHAG
jgi:hypothetical protein